MDFEIEKWRKELEQNGSADFTAGKYKNAKDVVWCQEEPKNQGAWYSSRHNFRECMREDQTLTYAGREHFAAPAVGYYALHLEQQRQLIEQALQ